MSRLIINKNVVLSLLLAVVAVVITARVIPPSVDPVVKLVISKSREPIRNIHQARDIEQTREVMVDRLQLIEKNRFRHPELGHLGFTDNFFVDISKEFSVDMGGQYVFNIGSDDGFSASINGEPLCEFVGDRPYTVVSCPVNLPAGKHQFELSYFQGYGNSGLTVEYAKVGEQKMRYFGVNSKHVKFD